MQGSQRIRRKPVNTPDSLFDGTSSDLRLHDFNSNNENNTATTRKALLDNPEGGTNSTLRSTRKLWTWAHFGWGWELLAWTTSLISMCAIIGILLAFDHKALSNWPYRIKLNTLISIFAQISSTALAISLSECISQLSRLESSLEVSFPKEPSLSALPFLLDLPGTCTSETHTNSRKLTNFKLK
jgi:hypothetical protein